MFVQLGVIPRTRNKFVEIVADAERYLTITHVKIKESKKQPFQICLLVKLTDRRISIKKEEMCSYLVYNIISLGKVAGKTELVVKNLENLGMEKICYYFQ